MFCMLCDGLDIILREILYRFMEGLDHLRGRLDAREFSVIATKFGNSTQNVYRIYVSQGRWESFSYCLV